MKQNQSLDTTAYILIGIFLLLLSYAGYISYKNIDFNVLKKLESQPLILPPPATSSATPKISPSN